MGWFLLIAAFIGVVVLLIITNRHEAKQYLKAAGIPESEISPNEVSLYGKPNPVMVCPHCQTTGRVLTEKVEKKTGISGAKATGAILTGGVSLLATGLAKKDDFTQAYCAKCKSKWYF